MPNVLKKASGQALIAGSAILTVPAGAIITIIGLRAVNADAAAQHTITLDIDGQLVNGADMPLPVGAGYEFLEAAKIVAEAGQVITATGDTDNDVDVYISYLEQT